MRSGSPLPPATPAVASSPESAAEAILRELQALANPERAIGAQRFFRQPISALGVDAPGLRRCAREWCRHLKAVWALPQAEALCVRLLAEPHLESRCAGFLVLAGFAASFDRELWFRAEPWVEQRLDNWALVDAFCSAVLSPLLARYPDLAEELPRWTRSPCLWMRRAALVSLVPLARRGQMLDQAYALAENSLGEREDLMHKALGWLLREAGRTDASRLRAFLLAHGPATPRTSVRYALERWPESERQQLMRATRTPAAASTASGTGRRSVPADAISSLKEE